MKLTLSKSTKASLGACLLSLCLTACHNPTTTFTTKSKHPTILPDITAHGVNPAGFSRANYLKSNENLVRHVENGDIQVVNEGHRITLIIPTDKYFAFDTDKLNKFMFRPLSDIATLVKCFPNATIYVAGFTDDVGNYQYKKTLSQKRAQAIVAYLWAKGVNERKLSAEGYGDKYAHADNHLIHGSALNRRVEIQWSII